MTLIFYAAHSVRDESIQGTAWYPGTSYQAGPGWLPGPTRINLDSPQSYQLPSR